jgi:ATP-dependent DNA helicase RecG
MVITFLQFFGTTETEKTPRGERFLDNRKFEGRVPELVEAAVNYILGSLRKSSLIEGILRRDIPEYPEEAIREAIANAVAHRDYSNFVRGNYIQVRLFADRLEVQSPGGLYGNVMEETLEDEQSTRNRVLMQLMEDLHIVENRGSGIRTMIHAMRAANLEPPRFSDKRSSFWVTFRNHTLMSPEAVNWLNQFSSRPMNDGQRMALVYLRRNPRITNSEYRRLNHVNPDTAYADLKALVRLDLIQQCGSGRWANYALNVPAEYSSPQTREEKIFAYIRERGSINNTECRQLLNISRDQATYLLKKMEQAGFLRREGESRWTRYRLY